MTIGVRFRLAVFTIQGPVLHNPACSTFGGTMIGSEMRESTTTTEAAILAERERGPLLSNGYLDQYRRSSREGFFTSELRIAREAALIAEEESLNDAAANRARVQELQRRETASKGPRRMAGWMRTGLSEWAKTEAPDLLTVQDAASEFPEYLSTLRYDAWRRTQGDENIPTSSTLRGRYGNWNKVLRAAGVARPS